MERKEFVNKSNAKRGEYEKVIEEIASHNVCPFCSEHLLKYHKNPILKEGKYWLVTDNMYPYKMTKNHIIFIHKDHIENLSEIEKEAWQEIQNLVKEIASKRKIEGGTFLLRFGDTKYTGASVTHLHAHIIQSNPDVPEYGRENGLQARVG